MPSTTATSLASLGTGLPPGQHGLVGYTSRVPQTGEILNALTWESDLGPRAFQAKADLLRAGGRQPALRSPRWRWSASRAVGSPRRPCAAPTSSPSSTSATEEQRIDLVVAAASARSRSLVYAYERELDHCGHVDGCESAAWLGQLTPDRRDV